MGNRVDRDAVSYPLALTIASRRTEILTVQFMRCSGGKGLAMGRHGSRRGQCRTKRSAYLTFSEWKSLPLAANRLPGQRQLCQPPSSALRLGSDRGGFLLRLSGRLSFGFCFLRHSGL